jgi:hypothetical protein
MRARRIAANIAKLHELVRRRRSSRCESSPRVAPIRIGGRGGGKKAVI